MPVLVRLKPIFIREAPFRNVVRRAAEAEGAFHLGTGGGKTVSEEAGKRLRRHETGNGMYSSPTVAEAACTE